MPHARAQACVSLRYLIYDADNRCAWPSVEGMVGEMLPGILEQLLALMDQVGSDELVTSLDVLIDSFARRMPPYAQGLCQRLADAFLRLAHDADTDSSLAASQCCSAIATLLDALQDSNSPQLFASIERSVIPLLNECLTPDASGEYAYTEFIEDVLEIMTRLTYYAPEISEGMWSLYQPLTKCFTDWAWDYLSEFQMALINYVSRAPAAFVSNPQRPEAMIRMMQRVLDTADAQDKDLVQVSLLGQRMLLECRAGVECYIEALMALVVRRLQHHPPQKELARSELIKLIAACLVVNPTLTLNTAESQSATHMIFHMWLESIVILGQKDTAHGVETIRTHFRALNDKKLCILGITSILRTPKEQLPGSIQEGFGQLLAGLVSRVLSSCLVCCRPCRAS